jgi:hypothetical protein
MKSNLRVVVVLAATSLVLSVAGAAAAAESAKSNPPGGRRVPGLEITPEAPALCNIMYYDANYGGSQFTTQSNWEWWNLGWFNDRMSSMVTYSGCNCTIYWDSNFLGSFLNYNQTYSGNSNIPFIGSQWNDRVSSIICYGP